MTFRDDMTFDDSNIFKHPVKFISEDDLHSNALKNLMQRLVNYHFLDRYKVGAGLAANQIGVPLSVFLVYISKVRAKREMCEPIPVTFWINATYEAVGDEKELGAEGCFSVREGGFDKVPRYRSVKVSGIKVIVTFRTGGALLIEDVTMLDTTEIFHGFHARVMQHECDHVNPKKPIFFYEYCGGKKALQEMQDPRTQS